jgi:hypothetical protein
MHDTDVVVVVVYTLTYQRLRQSPGNTQAAVLQRRDAFGHLGIGQLTSLVPSPKPDRDRTHTVTERDATLSLPNVTHQFLQPCWHEATVTGHFHQQTMMVVEQAPQRNAQCNSHRAVADHGLFRVAKDIAANVFAGKDGPVGGGNDDTLPFLGQSQLVLMLSLPMIVQRYIGGAQMMPVHHTVQLLQQVGQLPLLAARHRTALGPKVQQRLGYDSPYASVGGKGGGGVGVGGGADDAVKNSLARHGERYGDWAVGVVN